MCYFVIMIAGSNKLLSRHRILNGTYSRRAVFLGSWQAPPPGGRRRLETETKKEEEQPVNFNEEALKLHAEHKGKIEIRSKVPVNKRDDLSTP